MAFQLFSPRVSMSREMELLASIRTLESRVADLKEQLAERQGRIESLQAELAEAWRVAAVNERLTQSVRKSLSWKLTSPLRECRRGAIRSLRLVGLAPLDESSPRMKTTLRDRLRLLERRVRRYRKSLAASGCAPLADAVEAPCVLAGRAKEIHEDLCRAVTRRRVA